MGTINVDRVDHMSALVNPDELAATIGRLSFALQTAFHGPYDRPDIGARIATAWDAGITLVSPIPGGAGHTEAALASRGPGWWTLAWGVADLPATIGRLGRAGLAEPRLIDGLTGVEPWFDRFVQLDEASYPADVYGGLPVTLCSIEPHPDVPARPPGVAVVNGIAHVSALVQDDDLDSTVAHLSFGLQAVFDPPVELPRVGVRVAVSQAGGLRVVAPIPGREGRIAAELAARGPGWWSVAYGLRDLALTRSRLGGVGHEPLDDEGPAGDQELRYDPALFAGLPVTLRAAPSP